MECLRSGSLAEAAKHSSAALDADSRYAPALHVHGIAAYRLGRPALACALFESAIACDGSQPRYHIDLMDAYRLESRLDDALRIGLRTAELWPEDTAVDYALGFLFYDRGELDDAITRLRRVIAREPDNAGAHMRLGQALLAHGDCRAGWSEYECSACQDSRPSCHRPHSQNGTA